MRATEYGIRIGELKAGPFDAITDVSGVRVGQTTLIEGDAVRTGVTVVFPHEGDPGADPVFAGCHRLNGNGELTGLEWIRESGLLETPVGITNTFSVGVVRDAIVAAGPARSHELEWGLPVVGETYDGFLNDIRGMHVRPEHVEEALASASPGPVAEGNVGGGTGMVCHGFKGGTGTASRVVDAGWTVGVLVQANHGRRRRFQVNGAAVGEALADRPLLPARARGGGRGGSIIVVVATDAPLLPGQCDRLAQRAVIGIGRTGGLGEHTSGDLILCFATGNRGLGALERRDAERATVALDAVAHRHMDSLFQAVVEATEEAIVNAILAAETMTGRDGNTVYALDGDVLVETMHRLGGRRGAGR